MSRLGGPDLRDRHDLAGRRFTRLDVLGPAEDGRNGRPRWRCRCDCGKVVIVTADALRTGARVEAGLAQKGGVRSCGCLRSEAVRRSNALRAALAMP